MPSDWPNEISVVRNKAKQRYLRRYKSKQTIFIIVDFPFQNFVTLLSYHELNLLRDLKKMGNMLFSQRLGDAVAGLPEEDKDKHAEYRVFPAHMYKVGFCFLAFCHLKQISKCLMGFKPATSPFCR